MMTAQELFRAGKLQESIQTISGQLRDDPQDRSSRLFLFELLCFNGDYSRAEKHLTMLASQSPEAEMGALLYRSAMSAERKRRAFFESRQYEGQSPLIGYRPGKINGEPFRTIEDIDPRIGARLEAFVAGEYVWVPFAHIGSMQMAPPRYVRDLIWSPASISGGPALKGQDFGEVLLPALYPFSAQHERDAVKMGRETDWIMSEQEPLEIPYGQKLLVLDGNRSIAFLEVRTIEFDDAAPLSTPS